MNTKNFFKTLACAMLMPAVLLTTSCSKGDDAVTNPEKPANTETAVNKGYALPVTVNVTRQDNGTRATYNETTKKLEFSTGDKLFVSGSATAAGSFAGMLDYVSEGTFSGTIYTQNEYSGTADALFTAANSDRVEALLFPNGYESYGFLSLWGSGYSTSYITSPNNAIAATKAAAVEQFSLETAETYSSGFALSPENAILNFTITGLTDGAKDVRLKHGGTTMFVGSVTPTSGTATFALGAGIEDIYSSPVNLKNVILTIGDTDIDITDADKYLTAGKIYNITRSAIPGALIGQFSVSSTKKVYFSKGNLRYVSGTWSFFDNQYDYYSTYSDNAWDKFGWSTSLTTFGMNTSTNYEDYYGDFVDWGTVSGIGDGWYTLNSAEWTYLFGMENNEDKSGHARYRKYFRATVNGVSGVVLLPDDISDISDIPTEENRGTASTFAGKTYTIDAWNALEAKGCVFLPAAGERNGSSVNIYNDGYYWASNSEYSFPTDSNVYFVSFDKYGIHPSAMRGRFLGHSVRLVRQVK